MVTMILKMSAVTALYVLLTVILWVRLRDKKLNAAIRLGVGLIYGACSVLSTHFGVDYGHMMLNVRDMGPLAAGLFFHPASGVIAGVIGGVERYIAGRFWDIGSYTRFACGLSTLLAGLLTVPLHYRVLSRRKPAPFYAFFIGAVMEVFHMYVVLITHRDNMTMAYYVVYTCAPAMIVFNGLGMAAASIAVEALEGTLLNPLKPRSRAEIPIFQRFLRWMFAVILGIFLINIALTQVIQTQRAVQNAHDMLKAVAEDIQRTCDQVRATEAGISAFAETTVMGDARFIALSVNGLGGLAEVESAFFDEMKSVCNLVYLRVVDDNGREVYSSGEPPYMMRRFIDSPGENNVAWTELLGNGWIAGCAYFDDGAIQLAVDPSEMESMVNLDGLNETLSYFHVGQGGTFDILRPSGIIAVGNHRGISLTQKELELVQAQPLEQFFQARLFGAQSLCWMEPMEDDLILLTRLPVSEVYSDRNAQILESVFSDIILFAVIVTLISILIRSMVVENLDRVNHSLSIITGGDLNEAVDVRESSEFATLSDDINLTVTALKGYIDQAEKRIEQELEFARAIQDSALPKNFTFKRNDFELFATMDPAKEVGGDFYDFFFVSYNQLALVIADVSGKGIPAALFMMRAKTALRSLAVSGSDPDAILFKANNTLCEGNDAEMFVTAWIGIIDLTTGRMRCANAGHEYPVLLRAGGDYELFRDRHGLALAAMEDMPFKTYELELKPGDRLFVYTDGVPEAINPEVEQYGTDRMLQRLNAIKTRSMRETLPALRRDISDFAGTAEQFDDITMLGFIYNGPGEGRQES